MPLLRGLPEEQRGSDTRAVAAEIVRFARELDAARAAQEGSGFSGRPEVDAWLESDPNAFVLGVLFAQGIPAERAWAGPWELRARLGHLDMRKLARGEVDAVASALARPPALHRFVKAIPRYIVGTARVIVDDYGGDASRLWADEPGVDALAERLLALPGIGPKKAAMTTELLIRRFGVKLTGHAGTRVPYDVQVRRVMLRTGLVDEDSPAKVQHAAAALSPSRPSLVDLPLWLIGRRWCRPRRPACHACRLGAVCARLVGRSVGGVGARRARTPAAGGSASLGGSSRGG